MNEGFKQARRIERDQQLMYILVHELGVDPARARHSLDRIIKVVAHRCIGVEKLHKLLTDAHKRGADRQERGDIPDSYEMRVRRCEDLALEMVESRLGSGELFDVD